MEVETSLPMNCTGTSSEYGMSLIWDYVVRCASRFYDALTWNKVKFLAKAYPIIHSIGTPESTDSLLMNLILVVTWAFKAQLGNLVWLQSAQNLIIGFIFVWLIIRRLQGKINNSEFIINLACNFISTMLLA